MALPSPQPNQPEIKTMKKDLQRLRLQKTVPSMPKTAAAVQPAKKVETPVGQSPALTPVTPPNPIPKVSVAPLAPTPVKKIDLTEKLLPQPQPTSAPANAMQKAEPVMPPPTPAPNIQPVPHLQPKPELPMPSNQPKLAPKPLAQPQSDRYKEELPPQFTSPPKPQGQTSQPPTKPSPSSLPPEHSSSEKKKKTFMEEVEEWASQHQEPKP